MQGQNEILQLGASVPNDLICNGFGQWLNSWFGLPASNDFINDAGTPILAVRVKQIGTTDFSDTFCIDRGIDFEPNPDENSPCGTLFRLGSGSTIPARDDFKIETLLNATPESSYQNTGSGGFNSGLGKVTIARTYPATSGTDTIREFGSFAQVAQKTSSFKTMLSHDLVLPTVSYAPSQVINVELVWTLS